MRASLARLVFLVFLGHQLCAATGSVVTLSLPRPLRSGETAWLEVEVGVIERGAEIEITTPAGRSLGTISPFGIRSGREAGTYTIPLPADAISHGQVSLRLSLDQYGHAQRAPTSEEVKGIRVKIMPAGP